MIKQKKKEIKSRNNVNQYEFRENEEFFYFILIIILN